MKTRFFLPLIAILALSCGTKTKDIAVYLDEDKPLEERVQDALGRMTLEEKIAIIHAQSKFSSPGVPRLGIPELWCTDGPHGIRPEVLWDQWNQAGWTNDSIVAFPALSCLAATWNPDMALLYGKSIGEEARYRKKDVLLGPGVNIYRTPLGGRNFEYMGEDPFLAGEMVVPYVKGVQEQGVAACVKHFALNNEETHRHTIDVDLDDRALYEIYLPAFKAAVTEGGAWSIMSSYNLYRGRHVCHDIRLLKDILKGEWNFDGAVISDWGGVHDTPEAAEGGLDLEFGTHTDGLHSGSNNAYDSYYLADAYLKGIKEGKYMVEGLNDKASRVLRLIMRTAMNTRKPFGSKNSPDHYAAARKIAGEGIVLLKNDNNILPVKGKGKLLIVGENAIKMMTVGGGSSSLKVQRELSPLDGITERAGSDWEVRYERGYVGDVSGSYNGVETGQNLNDSRTPAQLIADATAAAADADYVLFIGGLNKSRHQDSESRDRFALDLPYGQDEVIEALAAANPNLAVILIDGNAVSMPWLDKAKAVLQAWYIGSEAGHAIADVVFGDVNPSGKLPFTFPVQLADSPAHQEGMVFPGDGKVYYKEGIFVGYRWFEHKGIKPLFPFGYGLSYTTFEVSGASLKKAGKGWKVEASVKNTGDVAGAEVVQLYVSALESSVPRPVKELKGFKKVYLKSGETAKVEFTLSQEDISYFDADSHSWVAEKGKYEALVGTSSADIKATLDFSFN